MVVFFVLISYSGVHVYMFDDLVLVMVGVVGVEGNLVLLSSVGNDVHFGVMEVVVEEILELYVCNKKKVLGVVLLFFVVIVVFFG